ncbi:hypothetical protein D4Q76_02905 [archaeon]|nr:MAG: hypothetical protein D4Q76_02905 [archaeon]
MKVIGAIVPQKQKTVEELIIELENRQLGYANGKILNDKSTILNLAEYEVKRVFAEAVPYKVEVSFPLFSSKTDKTKYFGTISIGDEESAPQKEEGRKKSEDEYKGFLHTHVKHEGYPSQRGPETDLENMSRSGKLWLIMGVNPDANKAVLRGYHLNELWRNLYEVPERILFKTENGVSSEIRYDKGKINYLFEDSENSNTVIESHLRFLELATL